MEQLKVQMLGRFACTYGEVPVVLNKAGSAKSARLLQMLLLAGKSGVAKRELVESLYGWAERGNSNRNLNNLIYRLKGQLLAAGLPEDEYVVIQEGVCKWKSSFEVILDTRQFQNMVCEARAAKGAERIRLYEQARDAYHGELLSGNYSETWFFEKSAGLKALFVETIRELEKQYRKIGDYKALLLLYKKAAEIYPFENWQVEQLRCNLELYRYDAAQEIYDQTQTLYAHELGSAPTEEMQQCFRDIESLRRSRSRRKSGQNTQEEFFEQKKKLASAIFSGSRTVGAYYCAYPSFLDYCRLIVRSREHKDWRTMVMFLTLHASERNRGTKEQTLAEQMDLLSKAICGSVRSGDAYTRYGSNHYLIAMTQIGKDQCADVFARIEEHYSRMRRHAGELRYYTASIEELEEIAYNMEKLGQTECSVS